MSCHVSRGSSGLGRFLRLLKVSDDPGSLEKYQVYGRVLLHWNLFRHLEFLCWHLDVFLEGGLGSQGWEEAHRGSALSSRRVGAPAASLADLRGVDRGHGAAARRSGFSPAKPLSALSTLPSEGVRVHGPR